MSSVDNNQSLNAIMQKIGINPAEEKKRANGDQLGQEDFLKLMTTQLQNQDPLRYGKCRIYCPDGSVLDSYRYHRYGADAQEYERSAF